MRTLKHTPHYTDYSTIDSSTRPNLAYSIGELLVRVARGEALPQNMRISDEPDIGDSEIDSRMDAFERHPFFDPDHDEIEAFEAMKSIDDDVEYKKRQDRAKKARFRAIQKVSKKPAEPKTPETKEE